MIYYCEKCKSLLINYKCTNRGCTDSATKNSQRKKWKIGNDEIVFNRQVSYKQALDKYKESIKLDYSLRKTKRNGKVKS